MRKYWHAYNIWLQQFIAYPARIFIWFFDGIITFGAFPFIWLAIYGSRETIGNLSKNDVVLYYILVAIISVAIQSYVGNRMRKEIVAGKVSTTLVKPYSYLIDTLIATVAYKTPMIVVSLGFVFIAYIFLPTGTFVMPHNILYGLSFLLSLIGAFAVSHFIQIIIGTFTFWLGENTALRQMFSIVNIVFSGELAPLVFLPLLLQKVAAYTPYPYMMSFPVNIYLGKVTYSEITNGFLITLAWVLVLRTFVVWFWKKGLRKYEAAGI